MQSCVLVVLEKNFSPIKPYISIYSPDELTENSQKKDTNFGNFLIFLSSTRE